jgi:aminoglycoside phosphotransferase (APT) family kinase protein
MSEEGRLPALATEIDAPWLTRALAARHPGVRVAGVELIERHEVTNAHARLRLHYDERAGAPETLFCKLPPSDPARRKLIAATGMGPREVRFYAELAPQLALRVPRCHAALRGPDGGFALLLEDLVASGCTVSDGPAGVSPDAAAVALEALAQMHVHFEDPARRASQAGWVRAPGAGSEYGVVRLRYGLDHHREKLTPAFAELSELYIAEQDALHALWHEPPHTVIHGDAHIGNLFDDAGRTGFLDWGMTVVSTPLRDVSYFLVMGLAADERARHERALLQHYLDARQKLGASRISWGAAWLAHRVHAAYTVVASCQIVTFPEGQSERRRRFADAFLARAERAIEELESRAALRQAAGI